MLAAPPLPPPQATYLAGAIPRAQLHMLEGEGHLSLPFNHNAAMLKSVSAEACAARGRAPCFSSLWHSSECYRPRCVAL